MNGLVCEGEATLAAQISTFEAQSATGECMVQGWVRRAACRKAATHQAVCNLILGDSCRELSGLNKNANNLLFIEYLARIEPKLYAGDPLTRKKLPVALRRIRFILWSRHSIA